jgi:hypothetical protein
MGNFIGDEEYPTWLRLRRLTSTNNSGSPGITGGDSNTVYPEGNYYLKTEEGNGFIRGLGNATPSPGFALNRSNPENPGFFYCDGFVEPNNETILEKTVTMTDGTFNIEEAAFTVFGQNVGTDPKLPFLSVELFQFLT